MNYRLLTFLFSFFSLSYSFSQTTVSPLILSNQVWTAAGSPYSLPQNTYIDTGVTVTVMPGAEIIGAGGYTTLYIDGAFNILGKADSIVHVSGLIINYKQKSGIRYAAKGGEAIIRYADVEGTGVASKIFDIQSTNFRIENSRVYNGYYSIYAYNIGYDKSNLTILNCEIEGVKGTSYHQGTAIYLSGDSLKTVMLNSSVSYARGLQITGIFYAKGNTFKYLDEIRFGQRGDLDLLCNDFIDIKYGILVGFYGQIQNTFNFKNNNLDSVGYDATRSYSAALCLERYTANYIDPILNIHYNNFDNTPKKVRIAGSNPNPTSSTRIDMTYNYWGTTDTLAINASISDYQDNFNIYGRVDYANLLSSPSTGCPYNEQCPTPNFSLTREYAQIYLTDSTNADSTIVRIWSFGDGAKDTTNGNSLDHEYTYSGDFTVCLYVLDAYGRVCDSLCKTVTIPALFNCNASYYIAVDTNIAYTMYVVDNSTNTTPSTQYIWDFGDGNISSSAKPTHEYAAFGKYELCLTIIDLDNSCYSQFCDSIGMNSKGEVLKKDGFTVNILSQEELGVSSIEKTTNVVLYPNPTNGIVTVALTNIINAPIEIKVLNAYGQEVLGSKDGISTSNSHIQLDMNGFKHGIYFVQISMGDKMTTKKLFLSK
jgi:hypothetical protein